MFDILNIDLEISRQLAENEIVRVENEQSQALKKSGEDLTEAILVTLGNAVSGRV